jgi:hypothetical protein
MVLASLLGSSHVQWAHPNRSGLALGVARPASSGVGSARARKGPTPSVATVPEIPSVGTATFDDGYVTVSVTVRDTDTSEAVSKRLIRALKKARRTAILK